MSFHKKILEKKAKTFTGQSIFILHQIDGLFFITENNILIKIRDNKDESIKLFKKIIVDVKKRYKKIKDNQLKSSFINMSNWGQRQNIDI
jgi:hypothetical protein